MIKTIIAFRRGEKHGGYLFNKERGQQFRRLFSLLNPERSLTPPTHTRNSKTHKSAYSVLLFPSTSGK